MTIKELIQKELNEIYLNKWITGPLGDLFQVANIQIEKGPYGDPSIEVSFQSKKYVEVCRRQEEWRGIHDGIPEPPNFVPEYMEAMREVIEINSYEEELPPIMVDLEKFK